MNLLKISEQLVEFAENNKQKWNELDGAQGDGDLGITIYLGAKAMADSAPDRAGIKEWFEVGGKALRKAAPSTMGILIACALIAAAKSLEENKFETSLQDWKRIQQTMINEIQTRGGAKLGDKTVLDAFIPAAQTFSAAVESGKPLEEILFDTARTARDAAEKTALLQSKIGRSSWLGDRSQNNIDGGAWVCYQIYEWLFRLNQTSGGEKHETS